MVLDLHQQSTVNNKGVTVPCDTEKSLKDILVDSAIIAGMTFFATFTGKIPDLNEIMIIIKATGLSFFVQLIYEKGIKKAE